MAKSQKKKLIIPTPIIPTLSKYKIGEEGVSFRAISNLKPVFAFDYLTQSSTELCINHKNISKDDLLGFLNGLKKISGYTYDELSRDRILRFHKIEFNDPRVGIKPQDFLKVLAPCSRGIDEDQLPQLYQFDLQYRIEARAVGFLFKGIFHIVWYDRNHIIYKRKN
jgi:hypothetical protein